MLKFIGELLCWPHERALRVQRDEHGKSTGHLFTECIKCGKPSQGIETGVAMVYGEVCS